MAIFNMFNNTLHNRIDLDEKFDLRKCHIVDHPDVANKFLIAIGGGSMLILTWDLKLIHRSSKRLFS